MDSNYLVSIVIVNYNTANLVIQAVAAIRKYTKRVEYEIIVVDNDSPELEDKIKLRKYSKPLGFILLESRSNLGFAKGNNLGIKAASGRYILLHNSDAYIKNDAISLLVDFLNEHKEYGVATTKVIYPSGELQKVCQKLPSIQSAILKNPFLLFLKNRIFKIRSYHDNYDQFIDAEWVWGTFFMIDARSLKLLPDEKLFDNFFMYEEDVYWCFTFRKILHKKIGYIPGGLVVHLNGASQQTQVAGSNKFRFDKYESIYRNRFYWMSMHYSNLHIYTYFTIIALNFGILSLKNRRYIKVSKYCLNLLYK